MAVTVAVLSDTHAPRFWRAMPPAVARHLDGADLILHAGDVCAAGVLDELAAYAPVMVVKGNNDGEDVAARGAPEELSVDIEGVRVAMIHDAGPRRGRMGRMRRRFPDAQVIIYGHSHIPLHELEDGVHLLNPGSPTDKRRQPQRTMAFLTIDGDVVDAAITNLD